MTKSVKELIYDYLNDGKEAHVAKKMRYFNQAQGMFNDIARDCNGALMRNKHGPSGVNPLHMLEPLALSQRGRSRRHMHLSEDFITTMLGESDNNIEMMQTVGNLVGRGFTSPQVFYPDFNPHEATMHVAHNPQMLGRMRELLDSKTLFVGRPMIRRKLGNMLIRGQADTSSKPDVDVGVMMSDNAIRRRITKEQYALIHEMLHEKVYAMHRQSNFAEAMAAYAERGSEHEAEYHFALKCFENNSVNAMARLMHSRMVAMHGGSRYGGVLNKTDYIQMQSKEKTMNYTIKLLTTELFHNEVILLENLVSALSDAGNGYFCLRAPSDKFEALLKSMADLGLSTLTVEDHEFISELMSGDYFNLKKIKMTVTAPTEERRSVILTFVATPERELVDVPAFAVEVTLADDMAETDTLNRDIHAIVTQYRVMLALIAAGIEYNHIPLRSSIVDRFLERRVYDATTRDRTIGRSGHALDLPTIMLTAGKSVEKLLANNILRTEYLDRMKSLGIEVAEMDAYDATAHFEGSSDHWMVHPVILDNLDQRITIAASEDQIMYSAIPRLYEKALGTIEREKALRFAGEFFGTERLDHKAE